MKMEDKNQNIIKAGALVTDTSMIDQPQGTHRFVLNAVNETDEGDSGNRIVEESNAPCYPIPLGFIPIGDIYIGDENTVVFFASSEGNTIIAKLDRECNLDILVNDSLQSNKIGLSVSHQVQGIYRLRLGCEKCIYFTDDNTKMRYLNINKLDDFKAADGTWDVSKFNLIKEYTEIPEFNTVQVLDSGGNIEPGSVNIAIEYVDEGLNPTEWITTSQVVNIYNDSTSEDYLRINGSINSDEEFLNFPNTTKSIRVVVDNLDVSFPFYRLAFIEANAGTGKVNSVKYTELIPISKNFFIYTGDNFVSQGTLEEIAFFTTHITRARVLEQIENTLTVHNVQGKKANLCNLQKYASRIKADVELKKVILNEINDPRNGKNPSMQFGDMITGGLGHMPGEIESFGIVFVFDDGFTSPVYHIPGKSPAVDTNIVYSPGPSIRPMSNINNQSANNKYIDNDTCTNNIFWGLDSEGTALEGKFVRHHRFPTRAELGIPLFQEESSSGENVSTYYKLKLTLGGNITLPEDCPIDPDTGEPTNCAPPFSVRVSFTVDGNPEILDYLIEPSLSSNPLSEEIFSNLFTSNNIVVTKIEETEDGLNFTTVTEGSPSPKGAIYTTDIDTSVFTSETKVYSTQILGIKFSGIEIPPITETNGEKIVGYYIVRNERTENEKTILDSAVLLPTVINDKYTSHGLLNPEIEDSKINTKVLALVHPEHKFSGKEYVNFDYIRQEGNFDIIKSDKSRIRYNDVYDGSSYDSRAHKGGNDDGHPADGTPNSRGFDGWCLKVIVRDNYTQYKSKAGFTINRNDVDENFYLNAVESRNAKEGTDVIYNISSDNKVGMLVLNNDLPEILTDRIPYVVMGRNVLDPYSNYRLLPYYKCSINMQQGATATVYSGDSYVAPVRYCNTVFWENRVAKRAGRTSAWNYIAGGLLVVVGAVLGFFTGGASTLIIASGISLIGAGALFVSSGIKRDAMVKAYEEEYDKGLRETSLDNWVKEEYRNNSDGPSDDEIQWIGDAITDLWFETSVNISLRNGMTSDVPTFLNAPGVRESGLNSPENIWEFFGNYYINAISRYPVSKLEYHFANKLLAYDPSRNDSRMYIGAALGEYYSVNPDYQRYNKEKLFYHLALEYDCCSECQENFPHRSHYSQQSFQEELTDNYRVFLPNNYRDLEGETGEITDAFRYGDKLYIHTEEALWYLPNNNQERVTGDIISFIGTGSLFSIPPKKIVDDRNNSAGNLHRWARIKSKNGIFFPSFRDKKWYMFDGQSLKPISDMGNYNFFKENMFFEVLNKYYGDNLKNYPYFNNPSNPIGVGFLSTYDTKKERLLVTKKDFVIANIVDEEGYELCSEGGDTIIFRDIQQTIFEKVNDGYTFLGIENCRLKFSKIVYETRTETREIIVTLPNTAHVYVYYDTSGSFSTGTYLADLRTAVEQWYSNFRPDDIGQTMLHHTNDGSERYVEFANQVATLTSEHNGEFLLISLCNEASPVYHAPGLTNPVAGQPSSQYTLDYDLFRNTRYPSLSFFRGINYPIATTGASYPNSLGFIQQSLLALKGISYTMTEADNIEVNDYYSPSEWNSLKDTLTQSNPYDVLGPGLDQMGWIAKVDRNDLAVIAGTQSSIITPEQFAEDINLLLQDSTSTEEVIVDVLVPVTVFEYVDGDVINLITLQAGWTMSYSLKEALWVSYHSYIPDYYMYVQEKFFSWKNGLLSLYRHNVKGSYRTFYGTPYPFIIEIVDNRNPVQTQVSEYITFNTEAKKYDPIAKEFLDMENITFNKLLVYNSKQISGILSMATKTIDENYLIQQTENTAGLVMIDRSEKDWNVNELRDIRRNNTEPMFRRDIISLQPQYYIDKVVNPSAIDYFKNWQEMESFRDKYLVIRLIFDTFTDVRLISSFLIPNKEISDR